MLTNISVYVRIQVRNEICTEGTKTGLINKEENKSEYYNNAHYRTDHFCITFKIQIGVNIFHVSGVQKIFLKLICYLPSVKSEVSFLKCT